MVKSEASCKNNIMSSQSVLSQLLMAIADAVTASMQGFHNNILGQRLDYSTRLYFLCSFCLEAIEIIAPPATEFCHNY